MPKTYSQIYLHWIWAVKQRNCLIQADFEEDLYKYITGIVKKHDQKLIQINGMPDHIHMLVRVRPRIAPSDLIRAVKKYSTDWINKNNLTLQRFSWQVGSGVFSVSHRNVEVVSRYIKNQKKHHSTKSFRKEYIQILEHHGVEIQYEYLPQFFD